ncbi:MAG: ribosomal RNA small subunit methyltransferase A [Gemmatimonadales bacterium]|nr:ribosomal RNA small subunit methyltransferase A [Gemmatimonadales bacterium]
MAQAKRRLGQHFLSDPRILARIADASGAGPGDTVLEIGPGPGGLTAALVATGARIVAIEKDTDMIPALRARFPGVVIAAGDALELDWRVVAAPVGRFIVTGNIPYNITSPLIDQALTPPVADRVVFLVQKEVADRVAAAPGIRNYGALSVGVQAVARVERLFRVTAGAFSPPPKVDSAVIRLTPLEHPLVPDGDRASFRAMVVGLFGLRRKQMLRALRELTRWDADAAAAVLAGAEISAGVRSETLPPAIFARLHRGLVDAGWAPD